VTEGDAPDPGDPRAAAYAHIVKAASLLKVDAQHLALLVELAGAAGDNAALSLDFAQSARRRGKPFALIFEVSKKQVDIEITTGRYTLQQQRGP
jgi:hypothetical protein